MARGKTQAKKTPRKRTTKKAKSSNKLVVEKERTELEAEIDSLDLTDPRQALFLQLYYDRESPTWGNAKQSAIAAGFSENHANQITYKKPKWWLDFARQENMADLIENHFLEVMTLPTVSQAMGAFGPIFKTEEVVVETGDVYKSGKKKGQKKTKKQKLKVPVMVPNVSVIKEKTAVAKIAAPAHDPDRYGAKKGAMNNFFFNVQAARERYNGNQNARVPENN